MLHNLMAWQRSWNPTRLFFGVVSRWFEFLLLNFIYQPENDWGYTWCTFKRALRQQKGGNVFDGAPVYIPLYWRLFFVNRLFPFHLSCDKYCNPSHWATVTTQCQSEFLVILFFFLSCKIIAISVIVHTRSFTLCMPACYVTCLDCHWCEGEGMQELACHVCDCSGAAGHATSSSCIRGWRALLSSQSSYCLGKTLPAADSFDRPAASVSVLTWQCVQLSPFWIFQEFKALGT